MNEKDNTITVDALRCSKIQLTGADGSVVGTIGLRYADNQLVLSFQGINLRDGDVYLPDLSHVYVLRGGNSVTLESVLMGKTVKFDPMEPVGTLRGRL